MTAKQEFDEDDPEWHDDALPWILMALALIFVAGMFYGILT